MTNFNHVYFPFQHKNVSEEANTEQWSAFFYQFYIWSAILKSMHIIKQGNPEIHEEKSIMN